MDHYSPVPSTAMLGFPRRCAPESLPLPWQVMYKKSQSGESQGLGFRVWGGLGLCVPGLFLQVELVVGEFSEPQALNPPSPINPHCPWLETDGHILRVAADSLD